MDRRSSAILGLQVTFLTFAVVLLAAPIDKYVLRQWDSAPAELGRVAIFLLAAIILVAFKPVRRRCAVLLAAPIAAGTRGELAKAMALLVLVNYAAFGGFALWNWSVGGEPMLARVMGGQLHHSDEMNRALSMWGIVFFAIFATTAGPIVEELIFRGFLYPAWRDAFGWVLGSLATASVFGLFHGTFWPQFLGSLVFVCVLRKTASLRGAIYVHAANNFLLWYPILGQFMLPENRSTGELHLWTFHLVCFALVAVLLPWYMWTARDARLPGE